MRKYLPLNLALILLFLILVSAPVFAQDSVFGNLSEGDRVEKTVSAMQGKDIEDYKRLYSEFQKLESDFEVAYGAQRNTLKEMVLERAKEAIFAKLGASHTFLIGLIEHLEAKNLIGEKDGAILFDRQSVLETYMEEITASIENAENLADLILVSKSINDSLANVLVYTDIYVAKISALRGKSIVDNLMGYGNLVQFHIDASAELGGDIARIQVVFDEAMLDLELAKQSYVETDLDFNEVKKINSAVEGAHKDLKEVTRDLRYLYSQSPWEVDETKFTSMEDN